MFIWKQLALESGHSLIRSFQAWLNSSTSIPAKMSISSFELFKIQIPTESGPLTSAYQTCVRPLPHPPSPNCLLYSSPNYYSYSRSYFVKPNESRVIIKCVVEIITFEWGYLHVQSITCKKSERELWERKCKTNENRERFLTRAELPTCFSMSFRSTRWISRRTSSLRLSAARTRSSPTTASTCSVCLMLIPHFFSIFWL